MSLPSKYGIDKNINSMAGLSAYENGGKGSGNFGHSGRPGEVGGSSSGGLSGISKAITSQKKFQDKAKIVQEDIEDRIGQKVKKGEEYTALDEASSSRFKYFHGEDGTEYTYDKENGLITKTNPKTGDQEVVTKQKDGSFHSRYEGGSAPIQYDGDTFYPDKDGRGMTTKDGKRTMMFPDEILYARQEMADNWRKKGLTKTSYEHAKQLYFKVKKDSTITDQDPRDKKHATKLAGELGTIIRRYEDEHPEAFLK